MSSVPLVVDLDGTLTPADTLHESLVKLVKEQPLAALRVAKWVFDGKAALKGKIADRVAVDASLLPYNKLVLERIEQARSQARPIILATASDKRIADAVSDHLGLFDEVIATTGDRNFSGREKRNALVERFGEGGFDYMANGAADLHVWEMAREAILVDATKSVVAQARKHHPDATILSTRPPSTAPLVKAARVYQWSKNVLIFVPLLASQQISTPYLVQTFFAFLCFCAAASSVYLINDIFDLESDRLHPRKRNRPFASGRVPLLHGFGLAVYLMAVALIGAVLIAPAFALALICYLVITVNYSMWIKRLALIDVVILAGLYSLRIIAGGAATDIEMTLWLLGFSMFLFSSLAFAKRYSEVVELTDKEHRTAHGRGYQVGDQYVLMSLGTACGMAAVLTLALYVNSTAALGLYASPSYLWGICPVLLYWISRIWLVAQREQLSDDPIVFAFTDKLSWGAFAMILIPVAMALWL